MTESKVIDTLVKVFSEWYYLGVLLLCSFNLLTMESHDIKILTIQNERRNEPAVICGGKLRGNVRFRGLCRVKAV